MGIENVKAHAEDRELVTSPDLISAAHAVLEGIDLDVASSDFANERVEAKEYYTPSDDGLNCQPWHGKVYLFPPSGAYFWDKKNDRWKMTRSSSPTLASSHAVWFRKMYKSWLAREISQGLYFTNCPDMIRYEFKIFDFPMCILRTPPTLTVRKSTGVANHKTCTSFLVYLPPMSNTEKAIERFKDIYEPRGLILC